ncbi:MAG: FHA domain-containing protein [Pirellulaceae bacterium]|nr:FHA domain-containing protein [Pirellulaceae bacterium]
MPQITLRVLDGADRGRVFEGLAAPVTIGREEGNTVQLNDDRVSRFHIKIQEDHDQLVLTDLESTNGTKVNGEDINLRILRFGDMITVGRSVLLFGSRDQIANRLASLRSREGEGTLNPRDGSGPPSSAMDFELNWNDDADLQATLQSRSPPPLPERLTPGQAAQLSELIEYLHTRLRQLLKSVEVDAKSEQVQIDFAQWQTLVDLQARLAEYLRRIGDPDN